MKYPWLQEYCRTKIGAVEEYKVEWEVLRYLLIDKMFIMIGKDRDNRDILTLKLKPENGEAMRNIYNDIRAGHYMNKIHWNSIDLNGCVPDDLIKKMIDESYQLVLTSLTKAEQRLIIS